MVARALSEFGRIDILINNAAIRPHKPFTEVTVQDWEHVSGVVPDGALFCTQAAIGPIVENGYGRILFFAGEGAFTGGSGRAHVPAAKMGLVGPARGRPMIVRAGDKSRRLTRSSTCDRKIALQTGDATMHKSIAPISLLALVAVSPAQAGLTQITACGTISQSGSYVLAQNLSAASGDCLVIAATRVTIDLAGFTITGTGTGTGITAINPFDITVRNGSITGFHSGVFFPTGGPRH
jgi:hypothetical protein